MAQNKKRKINGDLSEFILLALLHEGKLNLTQLKERTALQSLDFHSHKEIRHARPQEEKVEVTCDGLVGKKWLRLTDNAEYELTADGKVQAQSTAEAMEKGAAIIQNQLLSPTATARNTTASYLLLSTIKVLAGFFSGSVGLIADGADTSVDTAAAAIVWFGIKFKKEILGTITIIGLMFLTAIILCYDSVVSVLENVQGVFVPMSMPYVVIIIELLAIVWMFAVSLYQRFVGKRSNSLALISQSIDSKNSVYSSAAVIVGAFFSIFGVHWVDAVVGGFIALRISLDGFSLSKEANKLLRGRQPELSGYKMPFEKQIGQRRMDNFRNWIMFAIHEGGVKNQEEIVGSLEKTFRPNYMPEVFSDFVVGQGFHFDSNFTEIVKPLMDDSYLLFDNGVYSLTDKGKAYIKRTVSTLRYKQTEL